MAARLRFNAFTMNCVSHIHHGQWRRPDTRQLDYLDLNTWVDLAKTLERGKFDAIFLADVIGTYDVYGGNRDVAVEEGLQTPVNDPSLLIPALAYATKDIGFAFTQSILQEHPFNYARRLSTLDHITNGRVGWNVVTSYLEDTGRNLGYGGLPPHDERYERADEYLDVIYKLLEASWDDDAVIKDTENGIYADPAKIHNIDHVGKYFDVVGPHVSEPSPQRTPILFQAGASTRGRAFAAKHAEAIFIAGRNPQGAKAHVDEVKQNAAQYGRNPDDILFYQGLSFVVGGTEEEAKRKKAEIDEYASTRGYAAHFAGGIGIDAQLTRCRSSAILSAANCPGTRMLALTPRLRVGLVLLALPLVLPGAARAASVTRTFSARGETVFTVPAGVTSVGITATGERGHSAEPGGTGGTAARVSGTLAVAAGEKLYLEVGVGGGKSGIGFLRSGDGGGASTVQICPAAGGFCAQAPTVTDALFSRLLIAGGGGGSGAGVAGSFYGVYGGNASLVGGNGAAGQNGGTGTGGGGATASAGGPGGAGSASNGGDGQRGLGGDGGGLNFSGFSIGGAGGGGGLFGGGGSAPVSNLDTPPAPGGGGGTSWVRTTDLPDASVATTVGGGGFSVYATDTAQPSIRLTYDDTVAPQPALDLPVGGQQVGTRPTFTGTASTGVGDAAVVTVLVRPSGSLGGAVTVDNVPVDAQGNWSLTWPTALGAGAWEAVVAQSDDAGNSGDTLARPFTVDAAAPAIALQQPAAGAVLTTTTPVFSGLTGTKPKDLLDVGIDVYDGLAPVGAPVQTRPTTRRLDGTFSIAASPALPDGQYTAVARQQDNGGNEGRSTRTFRIDTTAPAIDIGSPADGAQVARGASLTLAYTCADAGAGIASCTGPVPSGSALDTSSVGERTETITATDLAGHGTTRSVRYVVAPAPASTGAAAPARIAPRLKITRVAVRRARRGCGSRRARLAATGRTPACSVKVTLRGTADARVAGQRLTLTATRRRARRVTRTAVVRSGRWSLTLTLPIRTGRWTLAASLPGSATMLPGTARRTLVVAAARAGGSPRRPRSSAAQLAVLE